MRESRGTAHLFNLSEIPRDQGPPLFVEFYAGDILSLPTDALLISAIAGSFIPTRGTVFKAIKQRYGMSFSAGPPPGSEVFSERLHHFANCSADGFRDLWVLEMSEIGEYDFSIGKLRSSLSIVSKHINDIAGAETDTLALPLLGTGSQGLDARDVAVELLDAFEDWAPRTKLRCVRVFAYRLKHLAHLNRSIDTRLKSNPSANGADPLLAAAAKDLASYGSAEVPEAVRVAVKEVVQLAQAQAPSTRSIAVAARLVAEQCALTLFESWNPGAEPPNTLADLLYELQNGIFKRSQWVFSYFKLLQACGNAGAHAVNETITSHDATALLVASRRVCEFTIANSADR